MSSTQNNNTTNNTSTRIIGIALIIAAFGIPPTLSSSTIGQAFITQHPLRATILVAAYETTIVVIGFASKVWQELVISSVRPIVAWIKFRWQMILSWHYWRLYCEHALSEHQAFELSIKTGEELHFEDVFVELYAEKKALSIISPDPLSTTGLLMPHSGENTIWDYLADRNLRQKHFIIVAAPGRGKTTLLKHILLELMHGKTTLFKRIWLSFVPSKRRHYAARMHHAFPILLSLSDHATDIQDDADKKVSTFSLVNALLNHMQKKWQWPGPESVEWEWQKAELGKWINYQLAKGRCLILLDGLDEIASQKVREQAAEWIRRQMNAYGSKNRFILTSRPYGFRDNEPKRGVILEIRPFTPEQIKQFIQNWYLAKARKNSKKTNLDSERQALQDAQNLLRRLESKSALQDLAANPLLLTWIVTVHLTPGTSLPEKRVELYKEICKDFLKKRQAVPDAHNGEQIPQILPDEHILEVLQLLAYKMMQKIDISEKDEQNEIKNTLINLNNEISIDDFLDIAQDTSGLFLKEGKTYRFLHFTLQEYLAAVYIKEKKLEQDLIDGIGDSWWHETIRLYCALTDDATQIIEACLAYLHSSSSSDTNQMLALAFDCDEEKTKAHPSVTKQIDELLEKGVEDPLSAHRLVVAAAKLRRRLSWQRMIFLNREQHKHYHLHVYADNSLVTCAEYQIFLDEQQCEHVFRQPDHWSTASFAKGQGEDSAWGMRSSDAIAFCEWLTARDQQGWHYRLPTRDEYTMIETDQDISRRMNLAVETGYWINDGKDFAWVGGNPPSSQDIKEMVHNLFARDATQAQNSNLNFPDELQDARGYADNLTRAIEQIQNQDLDRAYNIDLDQALTDALKRPLDLDQIRIPKFSEVIDPKHSYAHTIDRDSIDKLILYQKRVFDRLLHRNSVMKPDEVGEIVFLRWFIRFFALLLARYLLHHREMESSSSNAKSAKSQDTAIFNRSIAHLLHLCTSFALLELRIQKKVSAREGILLVRERRQYS